MKKENVNEEGEDERDGGADEANAEKEDDGEEGEGDEDGEEKKKRKEKKSYDYATKLNYLFRETRLLLDDGVVVHICTISHSGSFSVITMFTIYFLEVHK